MKSIFRFLGFLAGIACFVLIRLYEKQLFYDPLIEFYHGGFLDLPFPELDFWVYSLNLAYRYLLNTAVSLFLIWITFKKKSYIKLSIFLYTFLFLVCFILFWIIEHQIVSEYYMRLFYIRRFLIQPLLVIILIPAFYFQQLNKKS